MAEVGIPSPAFWNGRKVLVTGHTGFKGKWMLQWLTLMSAKTSGLSYSGYPNSTLGAKVFPSELELDSDIRSNEWIKDVVAFAPEIIFHFAAQSLLIQGYRNPEEVTTVNVDGTIKILELFTKIPTLRVIIIVTTDKVYKVDSNYAEKVEHDALGGSDPYSASKSAVEMIAAGWPLAANQNLATVRSGNVIGGGDFSEMRLLPDLVRAWETGNSFSPRQPEGVRPWLHVLETLRGYLLVAEKLYQSTMQKDSFNFAPTSRDHLCVKDVSEYFASCMGPSEGFRILFDSKSQLPETRELRLNADKAKVQLGWSPIWNCRRSLEQTSKWYRAFYEGFDSDALSTSDLEVYLRELRTL